MKRMVLAWWLSGLMIIFAGCKPSAATPPAITGHQYPTQAQARLPTLKLWIGAQEMTAEMALSQLQEETGLMFRTNLAENEGMIFAFPQPVRASFWMKNTILPLSAAYIAPNGTILEIHDLQPQDTNAVTAQTENIQYVLEAKQGWFKRNNITPGTIISSDHGPLHKVFVPE